MDISKLEIEELKKAAGWRLSDTSLMGALNRDTLEYWFGLPSCLSPVTHDVQFFGTIVDQDVRMIQKGRINFEMVQFRKIVFTSFLNDIKNMQEVRLSIRELVTLLADFHEYKEASILEKIRRKTGSTFIAFPGTLFYTDIGYYGKCYTLYSAVYNNGSWKRMFWPIHDGSEFVVALIPETDL